MNTQEIINGLVPMTRATMDKLKHVTGAGNGKEALTIAVEHTIKTYKKV